MRVGPRQLIESARGPVPGSPSQTKLFVSSEVPIYQIFSDDPNAKAGEMSDHMRSVMDDLVSV